LSQRPKPRVKNKVSFGKYILDSLSIGMYSAPLMILREYVQNSTDSIDLCPQGILQPVIEITVDGRTRSLEISDNGIGIPSRKV
jgi:HSP90 family molecular chaperone